MSDRKFLIASVYHGEQRRSAYRIECSQCGAHDDFVHTSARRPPDKAAEQAFRKRGWLIGRRAQHDLCPACIKATAKTLNEPPKEEIKAMKADPPPEMTREDKRVINLKLHEVYEGETTGYAKGWSDRKVAEELGVPRAWVAQVRDELFGPAGEPEEIAKLATEHASLVKRLDDAHAQILNLKSSAADLAKAIDRVRRAVS